ncbi:MAG: DUF87 domain-containing protein [Candidatus Zixiibacteriota bacterium]
MNAAPLTILGQTNYRNVRRRFGLKPADRRRPVYIVGKTGMGKSTLLLNCIVQDLVGGNGVAVFDPHGDLVEQALDHIPARRVNETVYVNPADLDYPIAFNVLHSADPRQRSLQASGLVQVFKKIWADTWGPRLEYVLRNAILALLEAPGSTLLGLPRLLTDGVYRARIVAAVHDPVVRRFWQVEFEQYPKVFRTETISPIQNKVGQFLTTPLTRNILGQTQTRIDFDAILNDGQILLLNLAKGKIGEDTSALLGSLFLTQLYLAALRRAHAPEATRRDFYAYIDELQSFTTEDFPTMLSEARKYRLNFAGVANQFIAQLPLRFASAILGNAGTLVAFATGAEDAAILSREFAPTFGAVDLQSLPQFATYVRLSIDGRTSEPFSAETLPPRPAPTPAHRAAIIAQSRMRYCRPKHSIEEKIQQWLAPT